MVKRFLSYGLSPFFWIYFMLVLGVFHPIQWVCFTFGGYGCHKKSVDILNLFLLSSYKIMGTGLHFENEYTLPFDRPILFISNHQSMFDIPGIIWYLRRHNPKFVSKKELGIGIPSISYNLKISGAAIIDRSKPEQALKEIDRLGRFAQENKYSVVLFPEGTRGRNGALKPFAEKGFTKFLETMPDALIVPIAIHNSWRFAQFGNFPISFGESILWKVLKPIERHHGTKSELLSKAHDAIRKDIGQ